MKIGIVGHGIVGSAVHKLFTEAVVYDKYKEPFNTESAKQEINTCDLVFICVPTPSRPGGSCDFSAVTETVDWITAPMCIKSTIPPGTTDAVAQASGKLIGFSPENIGEHSEHPWTKEGDCGYVVVGGPDKIVTLVGDAYRSALGAVDSVGPGFRVIITGTREAEMMKYMVNCFLAVKVALANQFYDACGNSGWISTKPGGCGLLTPE